MNKIFSLSGLVRKTRPDRENMKLFLNLTGKITQEFVEIFEVQDKKNFSQCNNIYCNKSKSY